MMGRNGDDDEREWKWMMGRNGVGNRVHNSKRRIYDKYKSVLPKGFHTTNARRAFEYWALDTRRLL